MGRVGNSAAYPDAAKRTAKPTSPPDQGRPELSAHCRFLRSCRSTSEAIKAVMAGSAKPPFSREHQELAGDHTGKDRPPRQHEDDQTPAGHRPIAQPIGNTGQRARRLNQNLRDHAGEDRGGHRPHPHQEIRTLINASCRATAPSCARSGSGKTPPGKARAAHASRRELRMLRSRPRPPFSERRRRMVPPATPLIRMSRPL